MPTAQITILSDSSLVWGDEHMSVETVSESVGMPSDILVALQNDMRSILAKESFVWDGIGTFTVQEGVVVCTPETERQDRGIAKLSRDWTPAKRIEGKCVKGIRSS
jgi:hypothetical protein